MAFPLSLTHPLPLPHMTSLPQIISKGAGDQSWSIFQNGQEWGMYLVNHLFEGNKGPHPPPLASVCRTTFLFSPCFPRPPEALPATLQAFFLICRENKLATLL